jgi:hypothetical protein
MARDHNPGVWQIQKDIFSFAILPSLFNLQKKKSGYSQEKSGGFFCQAML